MIVVLAKRRGSEERRSLRVWKNDSSNDETRTARAKVDRETCAILVDGEEKIVNL